VSAAFQLVTRLIDFRIYVFWFIRIWMFWLLGLLRHFSGIWLVVINPSGGQGKAVKMFEDRVRPILAEADIPFEVVVSGA
jgi:hypothetical protein